MEKSTIAGIIAGLTAGACWGLVDVLPLFLPRHSATEIALGRFFVFGLFSLFFLKRLPCEVWKWGTLLALAGNILCYTLFVMGMKLIGASTVTISYAFVPLIVIFVDKTVPFSVCALPLIGIIFGTLTSSYEKLSFETQGGVLGTSLGLFATIGSALLWAWYAVQSATLLKKYRSHDLIIVQGVVCLIFSGTFLTAFPPEIEQGYSFWAIAAILGVISTWCGTLCWNQACKLLPAAQSTQLASSGMFFGLFYIFIFYGRFPTVFEAVGISTTVVSLFYAQKRIIKYATT